MWMEREHNSLAATFYTCGFEVLPWKAMKNKYQTDLSSCGPWVAFITAQVLKGAWYPNWDENGSLPLPGLDGGLNGDPITEENGGLRKFFFQMAHPWDQTPEYDEILNKMGTNDPSKLG